MTKSTSLIFLLCCILLLSPLVTLCQPLKAVPSYALKPGDKAPPIHAEFILQGPNSSELSWEGLRGRVVVIDFWATWCPPCIAGIPHLNALVAKYTKDDAVKFIAVDHEYPGKVLGFLKNHQIDAWVVIDTSLSMFKSFTAFGIPHAVIVDRDGVIAAVLSPNNLTEGIIDSVLAGVRPTVPQLPPEAYFNPETAAEYFRTVGREESRSNK
jgi:thiol-disulfide isomerase/thioredoxin